MSCEIHVDDCHDAEVECQLLSAQWNCHCHRVSATRDQSAGIFFPYLTKSHLLLLALPGALDTIPTLDHVRLKRQWSVPPVKLQEKAAGIAEHRADLIPPP